MKFEGPMTEYEHQMVTSLCAPIVHEEDPYVLVSFLVELNALLEKLRNHQVRRRFEGEDVAT